MNELLALSGIAQARLVRAGAISSAELIRIHLEWIEKINPKLNAAIEILRAPALLEAHAADRRRSNGETMRPFEGVPFSVKDSIEIAGTVCSAGTLGFRNRPRSARDASVVTRLRQAGAIPIARTNLPDLLFAFESDNLLFGRTNNPYDPERTAGGSSGGEAALIAAGGSPFGLGSDAAGSVRVPAHYCGIASLKPTSGRLPRTGHVPPPGGWIEMLWQIGPMARRVEDLAGAHGILVGSDGEDRTVVPMPLWNEAVKARARRRVFLESSAETISVLRDAARALESAGFPVEEYAPPALEASYELEMKVLGADGGDGLREYLKSIGSDRTHPLLEGWLAKLEPYRTDVNGFARYWQELDRFRAEMFTLLNRYDVLLSPVTSQPAVLHGHSTGDTIFRGFGHTMTHNLTGWPAAVVRCGTSAEGLPIGVQIAAAPWREDVALSVAAVLEQSLGGWRPSALLQRC